MLRRATLLSTLLAATFGAGAARAHGLGARGMQPLDWHTGQVASVMSGHMGLSVPGRVEEIEGRRCMLASNLHVDVLDTLAFDVDEAVRVGVELDLATSSRSVALDYDGGTGPTRRQVQLPARGKRRFHTDLRPRARTLRGARTLRLGLLALGDRREPAHARARGGRRLRDLDRAQLCHAAARADRVARARDLALDAPFGLVDFVEVLQNGEAGTRTWFDLLDLGFRLSPAAGSDYPYIDHPGAVRSYVDVGKGAPSAAAWFDGLRAGRSFATNGPLLELRVNGQGMGSTLRLEPGAEIAVEARASLNPDVDRLARLELVAGGEVVASTLAPQGAETLRLEHRLRAERGGWLVLRALGTQQAPTARVVAVSAPVYLDVAGRGSCDPAQVPALVAARRRDLDAMLAPMADAEIESEPWETLAPRKKLWPEQLPALRERVARAHAYYDELVQLAAHQRCRPAPIAALRDSARGPAPAPAAGIARPFHLHRFEPGPRSCASCWMRAPRPATSCSRLEADPNRGGSARRLTAGGTSALR